MGTNYYLHRKCNYDKRYPGIVEDSETWWNSVQELVNGYEPCHFKCKTEIG